MKTKASIVMLAGKQLLGTARNHTVITDWPLEEGGTDTGFTSGEMLLLAIGSCASGSLRRHFTELGTPCRSLNVEVRFDTPTAPGRRDRIIIDVAVDGSLCVNQSRIREAALGGGVTSRLAAASDIEVRVNDTASARPGTDLEKRPRVRIDQNTGKIMK